MRKFIAILLYLVLLLTVVGCGKKNEEGKLIGNFYDIPKPDELTGRYQDIVDYRGAVVDTAYVDAANEIKIDITANDNGLAVQTSFVDPQQEPYVYVDRLGIAEYQIIDSNGTIVKEGSAEYQINLEDYAITAGDLVFIQPRILHTIALNSTEQIQQKYFQMEQYQQKPFQSETYVFHLNYLGANATDICATRYLLPLMNEEYTLPCHISPDHPAYRK